MILDKKNFKQEAALEVAIQKVNEKNYPFELTTILRTIEEDNPFQAMKATCDLLRYEIVGLLGPLTEDNSNVVQSILDLKEVPHIEVSINKIPLITFLSIPDLYNTQNVRDNYIECS